MDNARNKNILFYSIHPKDEYSRLFMIELEKYPHLSKQFILICVNDPQIKLPQKIKDIDVLPVLVSPSFKDFIKGYDVVTWLKNGGLQDKANGMDFGSFNDVEMSQYALLANESQNTEYHQYHNVEYNRGLDLKDANVNSHFSKLSVDSHVVTYDDSGEVRNDSERINKRLEDLRKQRKFEVPSQLKRIGGINEPNATEFIVPISVKNQVEVRPSLPFANPFSTQQNRHVLPFAVPVGVAPTSQPRQPSLPFQFNARPSFSPQQQQQSNGYYRNSNF